MCTKHLSKLSIFYLCVSSKRNIWETIRVVCVPTSSWVCQVQFTYCVCECTCVFVCNFLCLMIKVSFTTGPLCFHWSFWAGRILPAALWKVTVWVTDGWAANIKETKNVVKKPASISWMTTLLWIECTIPRGFVHVWYWKTLTQKWNCWIFETEQNWCGWPHDWDGPVIQTSGSNWTCQCRW